MYKLGEGGRKSNLQKEPYLFGWLIRRAFKDLDCEVCREWHGLTGQETILLLIAREA